MLSFSIAYMIYQRYGQIRHDWLGSSNCRTVVVFFQHIMHIVVQATDARAANAQTIVCHTCLLENSISIL
jgi:hypothetical protein